MIYYYRYLFVKMKGFNYSELHFAEVTFYKIHTLKGHFEIKTFSTYILAVHKKKSFIPSSQFNL